MKIRKAMAKTDFMRMRAKAYEKHPMEAMELDEIYRNTDMTWDEYLSHLNTFAEGDIYRVLYPTRKQECPRASYKPINKMSEVGQEYI